MWKSSLDETRARTDGLVSAALAAALAHPNRVAGGFPMPSGGTSPTTLADHGSNAASQLTQKRGWVFACARVISNVIAGASLHVGRKVDPTSMAGVKSRRSTCEG